MGPIQCSLCGGMTRRTRPVGGGLAFSSAILRLIVLRATPVALLDYIGPSKAVGARLNRHEESPSSFVENPTTYPCIAFGWPGLRRRGDSSPDSNPPHKGRESPKPDRPSQNPLPFRFTYFLKRTKLDRPLVLSHQAARESVCFFFRLSCGDAVNADALSACRPSSVCAGRTRGVHFGMSLRLLLFSTAISELPIEGLAPLYSLGVAACAGASRRRRWSSPPRLPPRKAGARTLAQDEESYIVFGIPSGLRWRSSPSQTPGRHHFVMAARDHSVATACIISFWRAVSPGIVICP